MSLFFCALHPELLWICRQNCIGSHSVSAINKRSKCNTTYYKYKFIAPETDCSGKNPLGLVKFFFFCSVPIFSRRRLVSELRQAFDVQGSVFAFFFRLSLTSTEQISARFRCICVYLCFEYECVCVCMVVDVRIVFQWNFQVLLAEKKANRCDDVKYYVSHIIFFLSS